MKHQMFKAIAISSVLFSLLSTFEGELLGFVRDDDPRLRAVNQISDQDKIRIEIKELVHAFRNGATKIIASKLSDIRQNPNQDDTAHLRPRQFDLEIGSVVVSGSEAIVTCNLMKGDTVPANQVVLHLIKKGEHWRLNDSGNMNGANNGILKILLAGRAPSVVPMGSSTKVSPGKLVSSATNVVMSTRLLIPTDHPSTDVHNLNVTVAKTYCDGQELFARNSNLDVDGILPTDLVQDVIAFYLDPLWCRIVYGNNGGGWIKSYGDNAADYRFYLPKAMEIDHADTIFIADTGNRRIAKFWYNLANSTINYVSSIVISNIKHPVDISIDDNGTFCNPSDDRIWILDDYAGRLIQINRSGVVQKTVENYTVSGVGTFRIKNPTKILAARWNPTNSGASFIAFLDPDRQAFVTADVATLIGTTVTAYNSSEFSGSNLTSVGQDLTENFWVGDAIRQAYHSFYSDGKYVASFGNGEFTFPRAVSKRPIGYSSNCGTSWVYQYVFTSDLWGTGNGIKPFFPGADAVNVSFTRSGTLFNVSFTPTNYCRMNVFIDRQPTPSCSGYGATVATLENDVVTGSYPHSYTVNASAWLPGTYVLRIEVLPYYNSFYGPDQLTSWNSVTSSLFYSPTTFSEEISGPSQLEQGESGTWTANVSGGSGYYYYDWKVKRDGYTTWTTLGTAPSQSYTLNGYNFTIKCTVQDVCFTDQTYATRHVTEYTPPPPGGCPYIYTYDSLGVRGENNILPQSEYPGNEEKVVTDYYQLVNPPLRDNGKHILEIREFEAERSYFKEFKLLAVDHPIDTKIAVLTDGKIVEYTTPFLLNQVNNGAFELSDNYKQLDLKIDKGRAVELDFIPSEAFLNSSVSGKTRFALVLGGSVRHRIDEVESLPKEEKVGVVLGTNGNIQSGRGAFNFRERYSLAYFPLDTLRLHLKVHFFQDVELDFAALAVETDSALQATEIPISSAIHSRKGNVLSSMFGALNQDATLNPGEILTLTFSNRSNESETANRDFVLVSKGQYEHIKNLTGEIPKDYSLAQSYPNPFNPLCTIKYAIPEAGRVTLRVYNILGAEVATLMNGYQDAGYKSTEFNASQLPSGIYYYRLTAGDFTDIKKMLLIK